MTPWAILSPSQFRPSGPAALTTAQYTEDFNETKAMGSASSANRTADETLYVKFWNSTSPAEFFDPVAISLASERNLTFSEESRLLALLNLSLADAIIGCWDAKYTFASWRPVTAIQLAGTDGNPDTTADPNWTPLIVTPPFPEYPSAHSCVSGAATRVLSSYFGENTAFSVSSDGMPGLVRYFSDFSAFGSEYRVRCFRQSVHRGLLACSKGPSRRHNHHDCRKRQVMGADPANSEGTLEGYATALSNGTVVPPKSLPAAQATR